MPECCFRGPSGDLEINFILIRSPSQNTRPKLDFKSM